MGKKREKGNKYMSSMIRSKQENVNTRSKSHGRRSLDKLSKEGHMFLIKTTMLLIKISMLLTKCIFFVYEKTLIVNNIDVFILTTWMMLLTN